MYIEPFWCGVFVTVFVEILMLIAYAIYINTKNGGK